MRVDAPNIDTPTTPATIVEKEVSAPSQSVKPYTVAHTPNRIHKERPSPANTTESGLSGMLAYLCSKYAADSPDRMQTGEWIIRWWHSATEMASPSNCGVT